MKIEGILKGKKIVDIGVGGLHALAVSGNTLTLTHSYCLFVFLSFFLSFSLSSFFSLFCQFSNSIFENEVLFCVCIPSFSMCIFQL
jgi:hypothetical protein